MVSEYSDLKFRNPHPFPVYLLASAERGEVTASLYGCSDGSAYRTESVTLETVEPPPPREVQGEERIPYYTQACNIITEEAYLVPLYNGIITVAYNAGLQGVQAHCLGTYNFYHWIWK